MSACQQYIYVKFLSQSLNFRYFFNIITKFTLIRYYKFIEQIILLRVYLLLRPTTNLEKY